MKIYDRDGKEITYFTQWDVNRKVYVQDVPTEFPLSANVYNADSAKSFVVPTVVEQDEMVSFVIPNILLQDVLDVTIVIFEENDPEGRSIDFAKIKVKEKTKPEDYIDPNDGHYDSWVKITTEAKEATKNANDAAANVLQYTDQAQKVLDTANEALNTANTAVDNANTATTSATNAASSANNAAEEALLAAQRVGGKITPFPIVLTSTAWAGKKQTIVNPEFVSTKHLYIPAPMEVEAYVAAGIYADPKPTTNGQAVFHCKVTPPKDLNIIMIKFEVEK